FSCALVLSCAPALRSPFAREEGLAGFLYSSEEQGCKDAGPPLATVRRSPSDSPGYADCGQARALLAFRERFGGCVLSGSSTSSSASLPDPLIAMAFASFAISVHFSSISFSSI